MSCVPVRGCRIGEGRPKVILPIVERTEAAILEKAAAFSTLCADCVEWRVDLLDAAADPGAVVRCLAKLRVALRDKLLLVTFRTKAEGGEQALSQQEYLELLGLILDTDCADLLDIEFFTAGADLPALVEQAHSAGVAVVCSSHDFHTTPPKAELVSRMVAMQQAGIRAGKANNLFAPKGTATRAEVATVLRRFVEIVIDPQAANGWQQNDSGQWNYYRNGESVKGWLSEDQKWYWLDKVTGMMFAGGWKQIDGKWYYFYADGVMAVNTTIDGYTIGSDGARK